MGGATLFSMLMCLACLSKKSIFSFVHSIQVNVEKGLLIETLLLLLLHPSVS